ncbi:hypothetical protein NDU88_006985 [Pleurodeles waltl]|uniref:Uncharacterized protein n=1 Tax=Pleurodeles waltl TaxID=8319 RepID=A0AAV7NZN7_PLEWA|nr:hypothetical protein NDU88_006985 [Pleurodeles waltl]
MKKGEYIGSAWSRLCGARREKGGCGERILVRGGSSCGRLTAPLLPGDLWFLVCGSSESGSPRCLVVAAAGLLTGVQPLLWVSCSACAAWLRWRLQQVIMQDETRGLGNSAKIAEA